MQSRIILQLFLQSLLIGFLHPLKQGLNVERHQQVIEGPRLHSFNGKGEGKILRWSHKNHFCPGPKSLDFTEQKHATLLEASQPQEDNVHIDALNDLLRFVLSASLMGLVAFQTQALGNVSAKGIIPFDNQNLDS